MMKLILNVILLSLCISGIRSQSTRFSEFVYDHNTTSNMDSDDSHDIDESTAEDYSNKIAENVRPYKLSADEYYVEAIREALEMLGDHQQTIIMVMKQLDGEKEHFRKLRELLNSTDNLIVKNIHVLKEKFGSELTPQDMTEPVQKSTLEMLLNTWKEVKPALDKVKSNEEIEELKKWLENVDRKTHTQYDTLGSLMAKIEALCDPPVVVTKSNHSTPVS